MKIKFYEIFLFAGLAMLPLINSDMYLPAFPAIAHYFNATPNLVQYTLSFYLLGLASMQLVYAPLAEKFGRQKVIVISLLLYMVITFSCIFLTSINQLLFLRVLQGVSVGVGSVLVKAMIVDEYPDKAALIFSIIFPVAACSPIIGPLVGGVFVHYGSWKWVFFALAALSIILLVLMLVRHRFSKVEQGNDDIKEKVKIFDLYLSLLADKIFIRNALIFVCAYAAWFIYVIETPFIFSSMGLSALQIGMAYAPLAVCFFVGNKLTVRLMANWSSAKIIKLAYGVFFVGVLVYLIEGVSKHWSVVGVIVPMMMLTFANGALILCSVTQALSVGNKKLGTAYRSSLISFLQLLVSAILTYVLTSVIKVHFAGLYVGMVLVVLCMGLAFTPIFSRAK